MNQQFVTIPLEEHLVPSQCIVVPQPQPINQPLLKDGVCRRAPECLAWFIAGSTGGSPASPRTRRRAWPYRAPPCCLFHAMGLVRKSGLHRATPNQARTSDDNTRMKTTTPGSESKPTARPTRAQSDCFVQSVSCTVRPNSMRRTSGRDHSPAVRTSRAVYSDSCSNDRRFGHQNPRTRGFTNSLSLSSTHSVRQKIPRQTTMSNQNSPPRFNTPKQPHFHRRFLPKPVTAQPRCKPT